MRIMRKSNMQQLIESLETADGDEYDYNKIINTLAQKNVSFDNANQIYALFNTCIIDLIAAAVTSFRTQQEIAQSNISTLQQKCLKVVLVQAKKDLGSDHVSTESFIENAGYKTLKHIATKNNCEPHKGFFDAIESKASSSELMEYKPR